MAKKINNIEEFEAMNPDEQNELLNEVKAKLGDAVIKMDMYVPSELKAWWDKKCEEDKVGKLSMEMLMSNFLIASLAVAINEGEQAFKNKTAIAQLVLVKPMEVRDGKIYVGGESQACEEDCLTCTNCGDKGGSDNGGGQTFH